MAVAVARSLAEWLVHLEHLHPRGQAGIELGLERVRQVSDVLQQRQHCPVITVGGTNGKGSTCAMLECILLAAGYRVGVYTSPHLQRYNERVRLNGVPAADADFCAAFARVEAARRGVSLTYFEFGTLAAWEMFAAAPLDAIILEVGLGGRLDATNIYAADCAIVATVALDHMDYLGPTREAIGREKAGICRSGRPLICGDAEPPQSLLETCRLAGADFCQIGRDFGFLRQEGQWQYWGRCGGHERKLGGLAFPALRGDSQLHNASCAIAALYALHDRLPVTAQDIRRGLSEVEVAGRCQVLPGRPQVVLDVAHNPQAAAALAASLGGMGFARTTWAVFGMMADKDIAGVIEALRQRVDYWLPCDLPVPRAATAANLAAVIAKVGAAASSNVPVGQFPSPAAALAYAQENAGDDDRILVFGSFLTVAGVMRPDPVQPPGRNA
ncbi:MAG: bifunctional tetrahydrofolate synthase/dihydrofolate synthase [Gammaproteobacteria bacterium]|nr:bifunctional tetrahydrofolate synthase/dihydrofolate synthase [Rhodocyclaceae bacterium]MBU3909976.1 bifunctional tetrahydrofolate synthase/dihydrofolate synthase [Gammaproteobacteria bacterium]MBU3989082.1 bifunctional tetrahydrofolate synthase/dihydrofolate synthase [Gammaproteobacteria bacterium]MBU4003949.1 bifunctional tetrahydrofolate synthase/dihydrofolate synthase [Gammaproteobacteria bacterium]MBU4020196.1 bifunctional tetrahydrofolate synthase/dihydrofolate synthase [Gammaproteobac